MRASLLMGNHTQALSYLPGFGQFTNLELGRPQHGTMRLRPVSRPAPPADAVRALVPGVPSLDTHLSGPPCAQQDLGGHLGTFCALEVRRHNQSGAQSLVHRTGGPAPHAGQHMAVGVQRLRYGSVPQKFLDVLGMDIAGEQQGGAGVPEVVEPDR